MSRGADAVRRTVEITAAAIGLIVLSPVLAAVALAVRLAVGKGVMFRQRRLGRHGREFALFKFRTMRHAAPGRSGPEFDAERITRTGAILRSTSLDELPSLVHLLLGHISLVGPRPLPVHYWERFRGVEYERFSVRPGITGLAQVSGRNTLDWPERLALDVKYVRTRSLLGDLRILARTVPTVFGRSGVAHEGTVSMHELPADRPQIDG